MRILVCGGREFGGNTADDRQIHAALDKAHANKTITVLIHGAARGADMSAALWGQMHADIDILTFPADWDTHGNAAGHLRNARMLVEGKPEGVIAFPGNTGTSDMVRKAKAAGLPVWFPLGRDWLIE